MSYYIITTVTPPLKFFSRVIITDTKSLLSSWKLFIVLVQFMNSFTTMIAIDIKDVSPILNCNGIFSRCYQTSLQFLPIFDWYHLSIPSRYNFQLHMPSNFYFCYNFPLYHPNKSKYWCGNNWYFYNLLIIELCILKNNTSIIMHRNIRKSAIIIFQLALCYLLTVFS